MMSSYIIGGCYSRKNTLRYCLKIWVSSLKTFLGALLFFVSCFLDSGLSGGEENGRRGYRMTFAIAYVRVSCDDVMVTIFRLALLLLYTGSRV